MKNRIEIKLSKPLNNSDELNMLQTLRNSKETAHLILNRAKNNSIDDIRKWLKNKNLLRNKQGLFIVYKSLRENQYLPIGYTTYLIEDDISKVATIGICLIDSFHGKGYGKTSIKLMIDELKKDFGIKKFVFNSLAKNFASRKLFKSFGFKEICTRKKHFYSLGEWHDVIIGELIFD